MKAMVLHDPKPIENKPLEWTDLPDPVPGPGEICLRIRTCGICHTDLHTVEGDIELPRLPLIPGHQIVGIVETRGEGSYRFAGVTMTPIPELDYDRSLYWEKTVRSVANFTRRDAEELLKAAGEIPLRTTVRPYPIEKANEALLDLKDSRIDGTGVLVIEYKKRLD